MEGVEEESPAHLAANYFSNRGTVPVVIALQKENRDNSHVIRELTESVAKSFESLLGVEAVSIERVENNEWKGVLLEVTGREYVMTDDTGAPCGRKNISTVAQSIQSVFNPSVTERTEGVSVGEQAYSSSLIEESQKFESQT